MFAAILRQLALPDLVLIENSVVAFHRHRVISQQCKKAMSCFFRCCSHKPQMNNPKGSRKPTVKNKLAVVSVEGQNNKLL